MSVSAGPAEPREPLLTRLFPFKDLHQARIARERVFAENMGPLQALIDGRVFDVDRSLMGVAEVVESDSRS